MYDTKPFFKKLSFSDPIIKICNPTMIYKGCDLGMTEEENEKDVFMKSISELYKIKCLEVEELQKRIKELEEITTF